MARRSRLAEEEPLTPQEAEAEDAVDRLLSGIAAGEGWYFKLYKVNPDERAKVKLAFLAQIENPETVQDLEIYLMALAREKHWGSGDYEVRAYRHGLKGYQFAPVRIGVLIPEQPSIGIPLGIIGAVNPVETFRQIGDAVKVVREVAGEPRPPQDAGAVVQAVRAGAELAAGGRADPMALITAIVSLLDKRREPSPTDQAMSKLIDGIIARELSPREGEKPPDALEQIESIAMIVDRLRPFLGGEGAGPPSIGVEIVRMIPQLSPIIDRLAHPVSLGFEARIRSLEVERLRLLLQARQQGIDASTFERPAPTGPPSVESRPQPPVQPPIPQIAEAIRVGGDGFFPTLVEVIRSLGPWGEQLLSSARDGGITAERAHELLQSTGVKEFSEPGAAAFVARFLSWLRQPAPPPQTSKPDQILPGHVAAACNACGEQYGYPSEADFEADNKACEEPGCNGTITRAEGQP